MTQALYRKWRPRTFEEVVGQDHIIRTLRNALASGRIHHAYLFTGPRGTGKTTTARLLAKAINCLAPETERPCNRCEICQAINEGRLLDLIEIDAASHTGVDDIRELRDRIGFRPSQARYKVYVIDEVHMLSTSAFNALLKTLEEPPPYAIFVLATTEPHKIPATVLSRCQRFDFRRIPLDILIANLERIAQAEGITADRDALTLIAHHATGSMRDAESLLDQLSSYGDGSVTLETIRDALGTGTEETVFQVADALIRGDLAQGLTLINQAVEQGASPRQFARQIVEHLRTLLLLRLEAAVALPPVAADRLPDLKAQAEAVTVQALGRALSIFSQAAAASRGGWQPQLPLEMAFIEAVAPPEQAAPTPTTPASAAPPTRPRPTGLRERQPPYATGDTPAPFPAELTAEVLERRWPDFIAALKSRSATLPGLLTCRPAAVEGDSVVLAFENEFLRGKVEEEKNKRVVEETLRELTGRPYRIRCVLAGQVASGPPSGSPDDDPVVRFAVEELGARVVR